MDQQAGPASSSVPLCYPLYARARQIPSNSVRRRQAASINVLTKSGHRRLDYEHIGWLEGVVVAGFSWTAISEGAVSEALGSLAVLVVVAFGSFVRKRWRGSTRLPSASALDDEERQGS